MPRIQSSRTTLFSLPFLLPILLTLGFALAFFPAQAAWAQPLQKSAINVDAGNTKASGATFGYRLTYSCNNTLTDCSGARVVDLLPPELDFVGTIPASPTGDVAAINVTPNFMGSGRTQVEFVMVDPLTAGNSGDLIINVRFPNGSTPDGTVATNSADGINLETTPGTFTTPPVDVTSVATAQVSLSKTLLTNPALLDQPVDYRLRTTVSGNDGSLNLDGYSVTDTLPAGAVFQGATPAADCEPGCVGAVAPALAWSGPFSISAGSNFDITVTVVYPSATFTDGEMVTNTFAGNGTPLGEPSTGVGPEGVGHPVETFTADPSVSLSKAAAGPIPPTFDQTFDWQLRPANNGNVPIDDFVLVDTLPIENRTIEVTSGRYNNPSASVVVSYQTNLSGSFVALGTNVSPGAANETYPIPALGVGEYVTHVRWEFGQAPPGMGATSTGNRPVVRSQIIDPDNAGNPVPVGTTITNCADLTGVFDPGGANQAVQDPNNCRSFDVSGPFVRLAPTKDNLSGSGPFNPGQAIDWRLRVRSSNDSSDPLPLQHLVVTDLLPVDLVYVPASFTYDDNSTGLPAPTLEVIDNYDATGRTLLRWTWPPASGALDPNREMRFLFSTTVRDGATFGSLTNRFGMTSNDPGLGQRCPSSDTDVNDLDGDSDRTDILCGTSRSVDIAPIAQLVSSKEVQALCDPGFGTGSDGTLIGGSLRYRMRVRNVGTVPMENFVLVDILPALGDTGVLDLSPRGSLWTPLLVAPITPPAGTTVFYSTSQNPCRPEVGGPTSGCDAPGWTTVAPTPITSVRSFKIEFGNRVLQPGDFLEFDFALVAPGDTPTAGEQAFNSFAYLGERSDGLGSLAAEPNKVGTAIGTCDAAELGDYVWVDTDGDGIQNDGETGVDGVYVQLFEPGADGVPRTFDDVPLAATITGTSPLGQPGWYLFPNLAPGSYYVQFTPPPTYGVTTADAGGDDSLDSDADPITACSPLVVLGFGDSDLDTDLGLLPPIPAALGDYVWFDRNSDGEQNESPFFGANGVTVRLYVDDGDGIPEPGGDDGSAVRSTATDDDVYGRPGYYLFDLLTPGLPYFVEFELPASATGFTTRDAGGDDDVDSDADTITGLSPVVTLAPGETRLDIDAGLVTPVGDLELGDQVWCDDDDDGVFEPEDGEEGVDGVELALYFDVNGDGEPTLDEYIGSTTTFTSGGFAGRYRFDTLDAGDYIVVVDLDNFAGGAPLAGKTSSTGNDPAPDPDDDVNGDDNGTDVGAVIANRPVTLVNDGEPTSDDGDPDTNLTIDFGFTEMPATTPPEYDYGDAPDVTVGTGTGDYRTTALDTGAVHPLGVAGAPFLGDCVDADDGIAQGVGAMADDEGTFGSVFGTCAGDDDEDGVSFTAPVVPGTPIDIDVRASAGTNDCVLDAWIDWDFDGNFEAGEQIATAQVITAGTTTTLTPTVPAATPPGLTYGRFRCSSAGGLGPQGFALDGEVEDHVVPVAGFDLGDAPDSYSTLLGSGGPSHDVNPVNGLRLGACVDTDADGQPAADAAGDDLGIGTSRVGTCLDDEDGVDLMTVPLAICQTTPLTVVIAGGTGTGVLDAWIDFGADGSFDAADRIANGQPLVAGPNVLMVSTPCGLLPGDYYARFRLSSAGVAGPTGPAPDGEVEDYRVTITPAQDLGDAPDTYSTLLASDGPRHDIVGGGPRLGACVDGEGDAGSPLDASGDDVTVGPATVVGTCVGNDDEDGIGFDTELIACETAQLTVDANIGTRLDAWIDFDGDGVFGAGDQVATNQALAAGANTLMVPVPCTAVPGTTYARFRVSTAGALGADGPAADGEVEDYRVAIVARDWGDAPDTYGTTLAADGPRHELTASSTLFLGTCVDSETDAASPLDASGDDTTVGLATVLGACTASDDEDGIALPPSLPACATSQLTVTAASAGLLDGWIDFGADGSFDAGDRIFAGQAISGGNTVLDVAVPCDAVAGTTYARFRVSTLGNLPPTGPAPDGEVEDYVLTIDPALDFGDAPDPDYPTTLASDGARHVILATDNPTLGTVVDSELDGQPSPLANGDDTAIGGGGGGVDDEDGVIFPSVLVPGTDGEVEVSTGTTGGLVSAWCDFAQDGDWADAGDAILVDETLPASTTATFTFPVPVGSPDGSAVCRFRISSGGGLDVDGLAADGEIEDHIAPVGVEMPMIGVAKTLLEVVRESDVVFRAIFEIGVWNFGNVPLSAVNVHADLATGFADAAGFEVVEVLGTDLTPEPTFDGVVVTTLLTGTDTLAVGAMGTIILDVRVDTGGFGGPYYCQVVAEGTSPNDDTVDDDSQDGGDPDPDGDGDPQDDDEPTPIVFPIDVLSVPTASEWGLLLLALLLASAALVRLPKP